MATIVLSSTLTQYAKDRSKLEISGKNLFAVMLNVIQQYPHLRPHLFDINGDLTRNMNFYLNDKGISPKKWQSIQVEAKDVVSILLASRNRVLPVQGREVRDFIPPIRNSNRDRLHLVSSKMM